MDQREKEMWAVLADALHESGGEIGPNARAIVDALGLKPKWRAPIEQWRIEGAFRLRGWVAADDEKEIRWIIDSPVVLREGDRVTLELKEGVLTIWRERP